MFGLPRFPLSVALAGVAGDGPLRAQVEWAAALGFRAVQWHGAGAGTRARDLSRSARRDIAAMLRRHELTSSGVDLWIPPAHYLDPFHADRVAEAMGESLTLAADLASLTAGRAVLCVTLPSDPGAGGLVAALAERARSAGSLLADASWPPTWAAQGVAVCLDPATILLSGDPATSPAKAAASAGPAAACARLSDLGPAGRGEPGLGRLDLLAYLAAITTIPSAGAPVLDLRGVTDQEGVARRMVAACGEQRS
jgi:sugar phosphate isomerase/epimerase